MGCWIIASVHVSKGKRNEPASPGNKHPSNSPSPSKGYKLSQHSSPYDNGPLWLREIGAQAGCTFRSPEERDHEVPMLKKSVTLVLLATVATATAWAVPAALGQDAKTILTNVSKAMGADNLKTLQYSGTATEFA